MDAVWEGQRSHRQRWWLCWLYSAGPTAWDLFSTALTCLCVQGVWHPAGLDQWTTLVVHQRMGQKVVESYPPALVPHCLCLPSGALLLPVLGLPVLHEEHSPSRRGWFPIVIPGVPDYPLICPNLWKESLLQKFSS